MLANETAVGLGDLLDLISDCKRGGFRFVTCTGLQSGDGVDVIYHFDRDYSMKHLRLHVKPGEAIPSISPVYPGSYMAENELQDFFGLTVTGLTIDYHGRLFLAEDAPVAPMLKVVDQNDHEEGK